jgi:hypothetical protein
MSPGLLHDVKFYELVQGFDHDLARQVRSEGCQCGGVLHSASYSRKPRGVPASSLPPGYDSRSSFCCAQDGCRRRRTPPSLRFLGRKVYLGAVVTLVTAMQHGVTPWRAAELRRAVGATRSTLARWRRWWREVLPTTRFWQEAKALLGAPVRVEDLPASLHARFGGDDDGTRLIRLLDFIKPVTTGAAGPWESISMAG